MNALIYIDLDSVHPVIDGVWHRASPTSMPDPGDRITMLCGAAAVAEYERLERRREHGTPTMCPRCDVVYRQQKGIPPPRMRPS
ncbi:hypothetical protein [Amycolatopsis sp. NPDC051716]|uniref:hypothetical protein n=1 Tax=Amycolatopsis sp. NPDC051716 TaxID=3155804 RepID=UPI00343E80EA